MILAAQQSASSLCWHVAGRGERLRLQSPSPDPSLGDERAGTAPWEPH